MRYSWLYLTGLTVVAPGAAAQLSARTDVSVAGRYVWHGISRAAGLVAQPSQAFGLRVQRLSLESGAVLHYELDAASSGELSETGAGGRHLGEQDVWGAASFVLGPTRLHAGVVRYAFRGDASVGGIGPASNTTEVFASVSTTSRYLNPSLEAWWDVKRVRGAFLRASLDLPVLGWPFPPYAFVFVQTELGMNIGQGPNPARPGELANFAKRGITHFGLGLGTEVRAGRLGTLAFGARSQLNVDAAAKADGPVRTRDFVVWLWSGVTIVLGGNERRQ